MTLTQSQIDTATAAIRLASDLLSLRAKIEHWRVKYAQEIYPSILASTEDFNDGLLAVNHLSHTEHGDYTNLNAALVALETWGGNPASSLSNWYALLNIVPSVPE